MSQIAIRVEGLGKRYQLGARASLRTARESLNNVFRTSVRHLRRAKRDRAKPEFWALHDVSFEIPRGTVAGVMGQNGAGKSTLLKILSQITEPTQGRATIYGRVGSLLEVGSGMHGDLTGRENIFLNGAILGMKRSEIQRKFDEIVAFAEVERFIDTPVKRYSNGMYLRLAFAVAAHLEPEILFIDEVLAVGDLAFQKKCLGKMGEVATQGRTVLFVSHNLTAIATLCPQSLWLEAGRLKRIGKTTEVITEYLRNESESSFDPRNFPDQRDFALKDIRVYQGDNYTGPFNTSEPLMLRITYHLPNPIWGLRVGVELISADGITISRSFDDDLYSWENNIRPAGTYTAECEFPAHMFFPRQYALSLAIGIHNVGWITHGRVQRMIEFFNDRGVGHAYADESNRAGVLLLGLNWQTRRVEPSIGGQEWTSNPSGLKAHIKF